LVIAHAIGAKNKPGIFATRAAQPETLSKRFVVVASLIGLAALVFFAWADATSPQSTVGDWLLAVGGSAVKLAVAGMATSLVGSFFSEGRSTTSVTD